MSTQVGTFKAERETKLRDVTMPKNREGEHAFLEALETAAESDATWARVLSLVDCRLRLRSLLARLPSMSELRCLLLGGALVEDQPLTLTLTRPGPSRSPHPSPHPRQAH